MTEEIKEILDEMLWQFEKYPTDDFIVKNKESRILLNYITNLQKENLALARENEQEKQFIKDCGFENTQQLALEYISLREEKENFRKLKERYQLEKEIYKSRNEKAIEYIENHTENIDRGRYYEDYVETYDLLNILQGGDE